jgi:GDPmannose 4,6-dehydratase
LAKRALVTGGAGQDGSYLIDLLLSRGYVVDAQSRQKPDADGPGEVTWHVGHLTDAAFLEQLIATARPDEIYNLAAISRPALSWSIPLDTAQLNAFVPQQICDLIRRHSPHSRFFQASSCEIFGDNPPPVQSETTRCDPRTPYGIAKYYAHRMVAAYREQYGLHLSSGILFNHESPRRPLSFVSQKIAHAAAALHLGITETAEQDERGQPILSGGKLKLGGLNVKRDFGFAGDYAEAIYAMMQSDVADDYVIGTGESHSIAEFCDVAFRSVGLDWKDHVVVDSELIRRVDAPVTCADASKLRGKLGWGPRLSFNDLVALMVKHRIEAILKAKR